MSTSAFHRRVATVDIVSKLGLVACVLLPTTGWAQAYMKSAQSVVKITCRWDATATRKAGQMTATGFVWRDSRHVVTALHAAVGCKDLNVYSEFKKDSAPAKVARASLVADLALLEFLDRDLGLAPIPDAKEEPDTHGQFYTWGYPQGVHQMTDVRTDFAGGLDRGATTLEAAYKGIQGIDDLFSGQTHPQKTSSILRVTTTLQPGQSGAPILDNLGRVVAIADGGLLGGYLTVNWSIPAYKYLPGLPDASDAIPSQPSKWAVLFSQVTPQETKSVTAPAAALAGGGAELRLVRKVTIADYVEKNRSAKFPDNTLKLLQSVITGRVEDLAFDIYEEPTIGTTVAIPSGFELKWNPAFQAFEARSGSGAVRLFVNTQLLPKGQPRAPTAQTFAANFLPMADWDKSPSGIDYTALDKNSAGTGGFVSGIDRTSGKPWFGSIFVQLDYGQFIGLASFHEGGNKWTTLSREDQFFEFMTGLGQRFTKFSVR